MTRYEYMTLTMETLVPDNDLDGYGRDGWRLVSLTECGMWWIYVFVREMLP